VKGFSGGSTATLPWFYLFPVPNRLPAFGVVEKAAHFLIRAVAYLMDHEKAFYLLFYCYVEGEFFAYIKPFAELFCFPTGKPAVSPLVVCEFLLKLFFCDGYQYAPF